MWEPELDDLDFNFELDEPLFPLDGDAATEFDNYRRLYRSFRLGNAKGAKGEVAQFVDPHGSSKSALPPFLEKLRRMLTSSEHNSFIRWSADGKSIVIDNITTFAANVLPHYFRHNKFTSFLRQMNMYSFYTTEKMDHMRRFANPNFVRDDVDNKLVSSIKRNRRPPSTTGQNSKKRKRSETTQRSPVSTLSRKVAKLQKAIITRGNSDSQSSSSMESQCHTLRAELEKTRSLTQVCSQKLRKIDSAAASMRRELQGCSTRVDNLVALVRHLCSASGTVDASFLDGFFDDGGSSR